MTAAAAILAASLLAACGGGRQEGIVKFRGIPPQSALQLAKDVRQVTTQCPHCLRPTEVDTAVCPEKTCKGQIKWADSYTCGSCQGTGRCTACKMLEQKDGKCFNCDGSGVKVYLGKSPACPNCKGEKTCPICKGNGKCDSCQGTGKVSKDVVKDRAKKSMPAGEEAAAPAPAAKEEPKKDAAPPAEEKK
jgi:hypothetical protein